ncbi:MAG: hypothetical protein K2X66_06660 [Cyanobacteria bacterium]|nr:hypothetical protein [Cyanobacteriota bacterium]
MLVTRYNEYLLPSLYDQKIVLLARLKKFREAQILLEEAVGLLPQEEANYLLCCYKAWIDRCCQQRKRVRERAQMLSLSVLPAKES